MGTIADLIKDIPLSAVLREKIVGLEADLAAATTQIDLLNIELRKSESKIDQLTTENKRLADQLSAANNAKPPLDDAAVKILRIFADHTEELPESYIFQGSGLDATSFRYYLEELGDHEYLTLAYTLIDDDNYFALKQKGRKYLMEHPVNSN